MKLQQDLAKAQTQVKTQGASVENLKAENAQVGLVFIVCDMWCVVGWVWWEVI